MHRISETAKYEVTKDSENRTHLSVAMATNIKHAQRENSGTNVTNHGSLTS